MLHVEVLLATRIQFTNDIELDLPSTFTCVYGAVYICVLQLEPAICSKSEALMASRH